MLSYQIIPFLIRHFFKQVLVVRNENSYSRIWKPFIYDKYDWFAPNAIVIPYYDYKFERTFTHKEVEEILFRVYEHYEISSTKKFMESNLSNCSDSPSNEKIQEAEISDIKSFIY